MSHYYLFVEYIGFQLGCLGGGGGGVANRKPQKPINFSCMLFIVEMDFFPKLY